LAVAFLATQAVLGPPAGVNEANVRRIRPGMTLSEVQAILGKGYGIGRERVWAFPGEELWILVVYDRDCRVIEIHFRRLDPSERPARVVKPLQGWLE
jgi:hypothetical protein